ncbi:hypothetical protein ACZ91_19445 [Streptomyces regensis]|nr:hypothetical protein ACZ91_19445 [Streptomyces regensis]
MPRSRSRPTWPSPPSRRPSPGRAAADPRTPVTSVHVGPARSPAIGRADVLSGPARSADRTLSTSSIGRYTFVAPPGYGKAAATQS